MGIRWFSPPQLPPGRHGPSAWLDQRFPDPARARPFVQMLDEIAQRWPDRIATDGAGGSTSYSELYQLVQNLGSTIHHDYSGSGSIGILLPSGALYVAAVFACLATGRMSVLLDEAYPTGRNADIAATTKLSVLLIGKQSELSLFPPDVVVLNVGDGLQTRPALPLPDDLAIGFDDPAFMLCTSGSTGRPKAIVHSQATMLHWARTINNALQVRTDDRALSLSSMSSLGGLTALLSYSLAGACQEMFDIRSQGIAGLLDVLTTRPVTILRCAPTMLRTLCVLPEAAAAFAGLRIVQTYGEPLTRADAAALRRTISADCRIRTTYASTECSGFNWFADPADLQHPVYTPAGVLMPDTEAAIIDDDGRSCAPGEAGELLIRSRYNALGEWNGHQLVAGRLRPDADSPELRVYHTGDIARVDADGVFVVLGRKDRMLKVNGQRLEPAEIEAILRDHAEVARAEVIVQVEPATSLIIAFVVPAVDAAGDLAGRLKLVLRARLPAYMRPSRIVLLDTIPLLPGGKVDSCTLLDGVRRYTPRAVQVN